MHLVLMRAATGSQRRCSRFAGSRFTMQRAISHRPISSHRKIALSLFAAVPIITVLLAAPSISATQSSPQDSSTTQPAAHPNTHPAPTFHQSRNHLHPIPKQSQPPADTTPATQALVAPELPH